MKEMHNAFKTIVAPVFCLMVILMVSLSACSSTPESIQINGRVPDFKLTDRKAQTVALGDYKGRFVFLYFWNSTADYCAKSLPYLQELSTQWSKSGEIVLLTIDEAESASAVNAFMELNKYDFPVLLDSDYQIAGKYEVTRIPISFFINHESRLKMKVAGPFENRAAIEKMVAGVMTAN
jgi:peroxiredoxin